MDPRRHELREKYFNRMADELSAVTAARFLRVDNQLQMLLDLQLASELPLIERR